MNRTDPRSQALLETKGLAAGYGGQSVVSGIDLAIHRGDILGLLGANGSGKTTLLKAVTGQLPLMAGQVSLGGVDLATAPVAAKARFGLAIDPADLPTSLSGRQYLELVASIRGCEGDVWPTGDVIGSLGLGSWLGRPIADYSLGTRAKVAIAAALVGAPPLLVFDESFNGLDPEAAWEARCMIGELAFTRDHAVILSTHVIETVPAFCNRAIFLADGQIVESWDGPSLVNASPTPGAFEAHIIGRLRRSKAQRAAKRLTGRVVL
ncbi:ABC transporter ATP-binding protein [Bradyrhizobium tropiciagri]|nr:ABC transporter ATP-binding protein [Bradyrhizobium tropiciagri]